RTGRDRGAMPDDVASWPGGGDYRSDAATEALAVEHLRARKPRFLWIALGDTDELAHRGDYRGYIGALRAADAFVGELAAHLREMGRYGERTALIVTTDHGRDATFSSHGGSAAAPIWLLARGAGIPARGIVATPELRHLRDVAPTVLTLLGRS